VGFIFPPQFWELAKSIERFPRIRFHALRNTVLLNLLPSINQSAPHATLFFICYLLLLSFILLNHSRYFKEVVRVLTIAHMVPHVHHPATPSLPPPTTPATLSLFPEIKNFSYQWDHMIHVFLWLTYFAQHNTLQFHLRRWSLFLIKLQNCPTTYY